MNSHYISFIDKIVPKVLSQVDRDRDSKTYGSCDRNHWHLKVRDFSSAILQQTGLSLALLYRLDYDGSRCAGKTCVREWAIGCIKYWMKIQLPDGSFNEYYPNEHGFPPTAFSLYGVCETYRRLGLDSPQMLNAFKKTGKYLVGHTEEKACNQEIASITALYSLYTITGEEWVWDGLQRKLERILNLQSAEGWFPEYGGADIGYLSVSFDMLAEYYWLSRDERVAGALESMVDFIQFFIHPDGTAGGEYASRNTTYFLPNGLEVMIQLGNEKAAAIKKKLYENAPANYYFLDSVDDRYCSHYLLHSFLRALEKESAGKPLESGYKLPCEKECEKYFREAGLYIKSRDNMYVIAGLKKGGVIKVFRGNREIAVDCGWRVKLKEGLIAATNWQDGSYKITVSRDKLTVSGKMNKVAQKVPSPILHFGLRVLAKMVGNKIIGFLKNRIILVDSHSDIDFMRTITFNENGITIDDMLKCPQKVQFYRANNFSLRHVASGKFYASSDLLYEEDIMPEAKTKIKTHKKIDF